MLDLLSWPEALLRDPAVNQTCSQNLDAYSTDFCGTIKFLGEEIIKWHLKVSLQCLLNYCFYKELLEMKRDEISDKLKSSFLTWRVNICIIFVSYFCVHAKTLRDKVEDWEI